MSASIFLATVLLASPAEAANISITTYRTQGWLIHQSPNFRVCTREHNIDSRELVKRCESVRLQLRKIWLGSTPETNWIPRCDVIVHSSLDAYRRTLGSGAGTSVGCATLKIDGERIVDRRIDIRTDADNWSHDALPHELTHIVLADRFAGRRIPRWADEGMGVLAETEAKREIRLAAFKREEAAGRTMTIDGLLQLSNVTNPVHLDAFYFQSTVLVAMLVEQETPARFADFVELALNHDYNHALKEVYAIKGTDQLRQLWRERQLSSAEFLKSPLTLAGKNRGKRSQRFGHID